MGAEAYWYFVQYQPKVEKALQELREREFRAGRYNPVIRHLYLSFPIGPDSPAPGAQHESIEKAFDDVGENGTRSILDIQCVAEKPGFLKAAPLAGEELQRLYGTAEPTREMVEQNLDFFDDVERGHCVYVIIYKDGKPDEILFFGYSFD